MTWPVIAVALVALLLLVLRYVVLTRRPCPMCGHPRSRHGAMWLDGMSTSPRRCRECGKECTL